MKKISKLSKYLIALIPLVGCSSIEVSQYSQEKPALKLEEYLNGTLDAYGIFQDRSGEVKKRFHCVINANWKNGVGTLNENFEYSDGTKSQRIWTIKKTSDKNYIGTAADVIGEARGEVSGNALRWSYILDLEVEGKRYKVDFDDWMYLMDDKVMLKKSIMSKFGIYLGEVTLSFHKR